MDWKRLLTELGDAGWTQAQIAERCGVSQNTVSDLERGATANPRFAFGNALLVLHAQVIASKAAA